MDRPLRRTIEARYLAPIALLAWVVGYLHGYGVGEREGQDSDPDEPLSPSEIERAYRMWDEMHHDYRVGNGG